MRCPQCQFDNRDTARFCEQCGSSLIRTCPGCGQEVSQRANFCPDCGTRLSTAQPSASASQSEPQRGVQTGPIELIAAEPLAPQAERRQLTVLFCDLVDSTVLSGQLDPEELREVVRAYQAACAEVIQRYDGHIAQYLGDGLLIYLGYPHAHEDDARRAIHTGLGIVEAIAALNAHLAPSKGIQLAVRVGIHTGLVVVGEMGGGGRQERLALGETPNVAARVQGIAAANTVVISVATLRLAQGLFSAEDLGSHMLKGVAMPLQLYRVRGESQAPSRLDGAVSRGPTALVGRELEVTLLRERWAQVQEGIGQVVWLSGEPGIGKSRLVGVVKDHVAEQPHTRMECRCSPYHQQSALYPVIDLLQRALGFAREDTSDDKVRKLEAALSHAHTDLQESVPLFTALLSLPLPERYAPLALSPQRQRQRTLETLLAVILELASQQPVLFIVEDLHWIDPSTLEFLTLLMDQGPTARIFTLFTSRPEFHSPWGTRAHLTPLTLNRLPSRLGEIMVERVAGDKALPSAVVQQIVSKTDGVPLFMEELTKMVLESGLLREAEDRYELTSPLPPLAIPTTLHDSLMARLDRLSTVKEVAQLGATLGRAFSYELLQAVSPIDEGTLRQALARLIEAELLYQRGVPPRATYIFKHALIQEAAYQSLLKSTRQRHHQQVARVLEQRFPKTAEVEPELLAHHYTQAELLAQAIPYWQRAGERAMQRSAYVEAISHLTRGLEALKSLPAASQRAEQELSLQIALGQALTTTKGQAAAEVGQAYRRARELCQQVRETPQLVQVLYGLWHFHIVRAEFHTVEDLSEEFLALARSVHDPLYCIGAHWALGSARFLLGQFPSAREHLDQSFALYDLQQHRANASLYGFDTGVFCLSFIAHALWHLGYPQQALIKTQEALALAHELAHPISQAVAQAYAAMLYQFRREEQAAQAQVERAVALCTEHGFAYYLAWAAIIQGWILSAGGQPVEGMTQIRQGLAALRATGAALRCPYYLGQLADACGKAGKAEEGLRVLDEALVLVEKTGERWREAELYRLKGELLLLQAVAAGFNPTLTQEAETCFQKGLGLACRQQAKSLELRAAMSLCRLWQQQGKRDQARELLAPVYGWFTEGFDTADVQEATALLRALG